MRIAHEEEKATEGGIRQGISTNGLVALLIVSIVAFHLAAVWKGYGFYRDIHLGTALHYAATQIDLQHTQIVGFNATGTPTIQELPLWQATVGAVFKWISPWLGWANVVSMLFFFSCLFPLFQIVKERLGTRTAQWTLAFFLGQPLIFIYAGQAGADGLTLAAAIWFWHFALKLISKPTTTMWVTVAVLGSLAAVLKLPFFMAAGLASFFLLLKEHRSCLKRWAALGGAGLFSAVIFLIWTKYTEGLQAGAVFPLVDLRLSNPEMVWWYFGDWSYRLSPGNWIKGGWRIFNTLFGSFVVVFLAIYAWKGKSNNAFVKFLIFGCLLTMLIFSHLVLQHSHYYLMFSPAIAILCAQAVSESESRFFLDTANCSISLTAFAAMLFGLSLLQGLIGMKVVLQFDNYPLKISEIIRQHTTESDKLAIRGGGWGGNLLSRTNRNGLSIWGTAIFENPESYKKLKSLGFNKLVMISESPLLHALQKVNPGDGGRERESYVPSTTPIIDSWPTLYRSDDILIKEIP